MNHVHFERGPRGGGLRKKISTEQVEQKVILFVNDIKMHLFGFHFINSVQGVLISYVKFQC